MTIYLLIAEVSTGVCLWAIRPVLSLRGSDADVAAVSLALQLGAPIVSLLAVFGQARWPYYARNRHLISSRRLGCDAAMFGVAGLIMGLVFIVAFLVARDLSLVGQGVGLSVLISVTLLIVARGIWQPPRIMFSTERAAPGMAAVVLVCSAFSLALMWVLGGDGAWIPMAIMSGCFAVCTIVSVSFLTPLVWRSND